MSGRVHMEQGCACLGLRGTRLPGGGPARPGVKAGRNTCFARCCNRSFAQCCNRSGGGDR